MNYQFPKKISTFLLFLGLSGFYTTVHAVDGVIEINQARALAGGVTPGDSPGFPVTISESGSYRLTGNLVVPDKDTTAILVASDFVTIDLNGFSIVGPVTCSIKPTSCTPTGGTGDGIKSHHPAGSALKHNINVRNGIIRGMGRHGIILSGVLNGRIKGVTAIANGKIGLYGGHGGMIIDSVASYNGDIGLSIGDNNIVRGNMVEYNSSHGMEAHRPNLLIDQ